MDLIQFLLRHAPFWAVPLMIIGGQYGYIYWLKDRRLPSLVFFSVAMLGFVTTAYYMWAGGPELTPKHFQSLFYR